MQGASRSQCRLRLARAREFADQALRILDQRSPPPSLQLAQGLALLWAYESNYGRQDTAHGLLDRFYQVHADLVGNCENFADVSSLQPESATNFQPVAFALWGFFCFEVLVETSFGLRAYFSSLNATLGNFR